MIELSKHKESKLRSFGESLEGLATHQEYLDMEQEVLRVIHCTHVGSFFVGEGGVRKAVLRRLHTRRQGTAAAPNVRKK